MSLRKYSRAKIIGLLIDLMCFRVVNGEFLLCRATLSCYYLL